jgi:hypothetical protein
MATDNMEYSISLSPSNSWSTILSLPKNYSIFKRSHFTFELKKSLDSTALQGMYLKKKQFTGDTTCNLTAPHIWWRQPTVLKLVAHDLANCVLSPSSRRTLYYYILHRVQRCSGHISHIYWQNKAYIISSRNGNQSCSKACLCNAHFLPVAGSRPTATLPIGNTY